jgi:hypothetical protein
VLQGDTQPVAIRQHLWHGRGPEQKAGQDWYAYANAQAEHYRNRLQGDLRLQGVLRLQADMSLWSMPMSREHLNYQENLQRIQRVGVVRSNHFLSQDTMPDAYRAGQPSLSASAPNCSLQHVSNVQPFAAIQIPFDTAELLTTKL